MAGKRNSPKKRIVYQEFGTPDNSEALTRAVADLAPQQQDIRVQATRSGRKGKTVTGFVINSVQPPFVSTVN